MKVPSVKTPRSSRAVMERYLPVAYFGSILLIVALVLPSVLRTPNQQPNTTPEVSPNAPPQPSVQAIVATLNRGSTGTAGAGPGRASGLNAGGTTPATLPPPPPAPNAPAACPVGFGNPLRQTESVYAAPCALPFTGANGGATAKGVTGSEVRVAIADEGASTSYSGPVPDTAQTGESSVDRTVRVFQAYFNRSYQTYGRQVRLFAVQDTLGDNNSAYQAAVTEDQNDHVFASAADIPSQCDELARRQIIAFCYAVPTDHYQPREPYYYSFRMDTNRAVRLAGEEICKQLAGHPPVLNGKQDLSFNYTKPRVWGMVYIQDGVYDSDLPVMRAALAACGVKLAVAVGYNQVTDQQSVQSAVTRLRAAGVTTIIADADFASTTEMTYDASAEGYFPEWFIPGNQTLDTTIARLMDQAQWPHAFGMGTSLAPQPLETTECNRAYHTVDPGNDPDSSVCQYLFYDLTEIFNGIQEAGPSLNPQTFREGLSKMGYRDFQAPSWSARWAGGGGFGPGSDAFVQDAALVWWSGNSNPNDGEPGAYEYVDGGRRFQLGQLPKGPPLFFQNGTVDVSG